MTKKVLISLDDIEKFIPAFPSNLGRMQYSKFGVQAADNEVELNICYARSLFLKWFDAQPDAELSKMETTESGVTIEGIEQLISHYRCEVYHNGLLPDSSDEEIEEMQALEDSAYTKLLQAIKEYKGSGEPTE